MGSNGAMGAVRVANEVIASIAALAACEIEGVSGMDETSARHFGDWVRRQTAHRGVRVQVEADRSIHLDVFITVDSEAKLAQVANAVQDNVVEATERMLGLEVGEVNVFVSSIAFAS
ncbi:MAG TPA: Asp23/Gls24 family envelope stress response protein [Candidatus Dormibacteraeota bacterium]